MVVNSLPSLIADGLEGDVCGLRLMWWEPDKDQIRKNEERLIKVAKLREEYLERNFRNFLRGIDSSRTRASVKRSVIARSRAKYHTRKSHLYYFQAPRHLWLRPMRACRVADALCPKRADTWVPVHLRRQEVVPEIEVKEFSFLTNPNGTIAALIDIVNAESTLHAAHIHFLDDTLLDITPFMVLAEMRPEMLPIFRGGRMSPQVQRVISALRLAKPLGMSLPAAVNQANIWAMPLRKRRPKNTSSSDRFEHPTTIEKVADEFCEQVDRWLGVPEIEQALTREGRKSIKCIVGELLDNAERHGIETGDGDWSVAATMMRLRSADGESVLSCRFGFLNLGSSFYESLMRGPEDIRNDVRTYIKRHRGKCADQVLGTIIALQDGVTSDTAAYLHRRGGTGLQEVVSFVGDLGGEGQCVEGPVITILSGQACLTIKEPYFSPTTTNEGARQNWLNEANTPDQPPDNAHAMLLDVPFPGTLISISFRLDPDYLKSSIDE